MNDGIMVDVHQTGYTDGYDIFFYYKSYDGMYIAQKSQNGVLRYKKYERGAKLEHPTIILTHDEINAFAEALDKINVKIESDSVLKGKYESTFLHLNDMRKIVSKNLNVILDDIKKPE